MPELIPQRHRPLQEIDLSHPWLRTGILASRPLASSPPLSTLSAPLLRPSCPPRPAAVYPARSTSTPPRTIATATPSNSQQMHTRRRTRGGTLSYLLNLFIAQENRSPLLYSDFLSITYFLVESKHWLRSCLCLVCTFRSAMARSTLYSQCLWFSPFIFHTS